MRCLKEQFMEERGPKTLSFKHSNIANKLDYMRTFNKNEKYL